MLSEDIKLPEQAKTYGIPSSQSISTCTGSFGLQVSRAQTDDVYTMHLSQLSTTECGNSIVLQ